MLKAQEYASRVSRVVLAARRLHAGIWVPKVNADNWVPGNQISMRDSRRRGLTRGLYTVDDPDFILRVGKAVWCS